MQRLDHCCLSGAASDSPKVIVRAIQQVGLVVATAEGLLYEYGIRDLSSQHGPKWSLEGEWTLLGAAGLS